MLFSPLIHPPLLAALARAGQGATVLLADGHFPVSTAVGPRADVVYLNLSPGIVDVPTVFTVVRQVVPVEEAAVMVPSYDETDPPAVAEYRAAGLAPQFRALDRSSFFRATRGPDLAVAIVTADTRTYGSLLLTIGVRAL